MTTAPYPPPQAAGTEAAAPPPARASFLSRKRRLLAVLAVLALALGLASLFAPEAGLRWGLAEALRRVGMVTVSLGGADVSLFGGRIVVKHMSAQPPTGQGKALGLEDLRLSFNWRPLLGRRVSLETLALTGLSIEAARAADGSWVVNGLPLSVGAAGGEAGWSFDVESLSVTDSRLMLSDGRTRLDVAVQSLTVSSLRSWEPGTPARFRLDGRANGAPVTIEGTALPFAPEPSFNLDLAVEGFDLAVAAPLAKAQGVDGLTGKASARLRASGGLTSQAVEGRLTLAGTAATVSGTSLKAGSLEWQGRVAMNGKVSAQGRLAGGAVEVDRVSAASLSLDLGKAEMDAKATRLQLENAALAADGVRLAGDEFQAELRKLGWIGGAKLSLADGSGPVEGRFEADGIGVTLGPRHLDGRHALAEGRLELLPPSAGPDALPVAGRLRVSAESLILREPRRALDLARAERLAVGELRLTAEGAMVGGLDLQRVALLRGVGKEGAAYPWRVEAVRLGLDRARLSPDGAVDAGEARLASAILRLTRTAKGFQGFQLPPLPGAATAGEPAELPRFALARLDVSGESAILFEDRTPSETVRLELKPVDLSLAGLDSARPEGDSPFRLGARMGGASLSASGTLRPFARDLSGQGRGEIRSLDLPPLSPYAADALGVHLHTGQFDGDLHVTLAEGALDGRMDLTLSDLFIAQPDPNAPIARKVDMPVETVLDLLRDGEDRIRLSIPVGGKLDDPRFDVSDAVAQAIGGALRSTVFTTLKVAFPVAALISMVVDDDRARIQLQPLAFPPGGDALAEEQRGGLATVAQLMQKRPNLRLHLCGVASLAADGPVLATRKRLEEGGILARLQALLNLPSKDGQEAGPPQPPDRETLAALADRRAQAAKVWLTDRAGIAAARLFTCRARVDEGDGALPRVEMLL